MNTERLIETLAHDASVFVSILSDLPDEVGRRKARPSDWSLLEIAGHLLDEERLDFRARIEATLDGRPWTPIDPEGWVTAHGYAERRLADVVREWSDERARSVAWLRSLGDADWSAAHEHPSLGTLRAGDVLASWVAHDALHLRQIAKRLYEGVVADAAPYTPDYAGPLA